MNIYYFSTALSDDIYNDIIGKSKKYKPTFSGIGFDRNIAFGLSDFANVLGVSFYPIPSFPKYSRLIEKANFFSGNGCSYFVPRIIDLPLIKEYSFFFSAIKFVKKHYVQGTGNILLISGLYRCFLRPARVIREKFNLKICVIVPDLPELMIDYRKDYSKLRKTLNNLDIKNAKRYRDCIDSYIFLSSYLESTINRNNKPMIIVDGVTNIDSFPKANKSEDRIIFYAGKVSSTFGVDKLVNAFINAELSTNVKLYICGDGDYAPVLRKISDSNSSIKFLGSVPHNEVLKFEVMSTLLVDPRPSEMDISRMSFPSKIIEYMASGTPVLTTNMPCFSGDYKDYQFRINDESIEGIALTLKNIIEMDDEELNKFGLKARRFILENKTIQKQCKRINDFLVGLEG